MNISDPYLFNFTPSADYAILDAMEDINLGVAAALQNKQLFNKATKGNVKINVMAGVSVSSMVLTEAMAALQRGQYALFDQMAGLFYAISQQVVPVKFTVDLKLVSAGENDGYKVKVNNIQTDNDYATLTANFISVDIGTSSLNKDTPYTTVFPLLTCNTMGVNIKSSAGFNANSFNGMRLAILRDMKNKFGKNSTNYKLDSVSCDNRGVCEGLGGYFDQVDRHVAILPSPEGVLKFGSDKSRITAFRQSDISDTVRTVRHELIHALPRTVPHLEENMYGASAADVREETIAHFVADHFHVFENIANYIPVNSKTGLAGTSAAFVSRLPEINDSIIKQSANVVALAQAKGTSFEQDPFVQMVLTNCPVVVLESIDKQVDSEVWSIGRVNSVV